MLGSGSVLPRYSVIIVAQRFVTKCDVASAYRRSFAPFRTALLFLARVPYLYLYYM